MLPVDYRQQLTGKQSPNAGAQTPREPLPLDQHHWAPLSSVELNHRYLP
jgi:hypothetical protein